MVNRYYIVRCKQKEKMKNSILIVISVLIAGCLGCSTDWDIEIWEQKIEHSNLSIYIFDAWGGRDTHVFGLKIKETEKGFTQNDVMKGNEFDYLKSIPNKETIEVLKVIRQSSRNSNIPLSKKNYKIKGINVTQEIYKYNGKPIREHSLKKYKFKTFKETRDSLIFYQNKSQLVNGLDFNRIAIPKGNVYLMAVNQKLARVVYEDFLILEDEKSNTRNKITTSTKYFSPIDEINISDFSDYGIYKPVREK